MKNDVLQRIKTQIARCLVWWMLFSVSAAWTFLPKGVPFFLQILGCGIIQVICYYCWLILLKLKNTSPNLIFQTTFSVTSFAEMDQSSTTWNLCLQVHLLLITLRLQMSWSMQRQMSPALTLKPAPLLWMVHVSNSSAPST